MVCIGQCDRHPDCGRGLKCGYLFNPTGPPNCSFYHPPEHFRLREQMQSTASNAPSDLRFNSPPPRGPLIFGRSSGSIDYEIGRKHLLSPHSDGSRGSHSSHHSQYSQHSARHGSGSFDRNHSRDRFHSADRSPKEWHKNQRGKSSNPHKQAFQFRKRGAWSKDEEQKLLRYAETYGIRGDWIPGDHYHKLTTTFNRRVEDIKSCLIRLRYSGNFQTGHHTLDPQRIQQEKAMRNTMSLEEGQIAEFDSPNKAKRSGPIRSSPCPKPWRDFEDDYIAAFIQKKGHKLQMGHLQEIKDHLHRSLFDIKKRLSWLKEQGQITCDLNGLNERHHYGSRSDVNSDGIPTVHAHNGVHDGNHSTPSPKDIELQSAMIKAADYSVSVPQPTQMQSQCVPQRLPALISDIHSNHSSPLKAEVHPIHSIHPQRVIPPPPPPRHKVPQMITISPPIHSTNNRKRKFNEITPDTLSASPMEDAQQRQMTILDLSLSLSDKLQEGSNLLESMNTRLPEEPHIQDMYIEALKKQIAWVRKTNHQWYKFQKSISSERRDSMTDNRRHFTSPQIAAAVDPRMKHENVNGESMKRNRDVLP